MCNADKWHCVYQQCSVDVQCISVLRTNMTAAYQINIGIKWAGCKANHSPPTGAEVKRTGIYTATPPYVFMV
jgi:hypothetical protein